MARFIDYSTCRFQSTRSRRARQPYHCRVVVFITFQSTRSRRARPIMAAANNQLTPVSIHALAKSATVSSRWQMLQKLCFNPRAREERDYPISIYSDPYMKFQSTRSRRARLRVNTAPTDIPVFQSTRSRRARRALMILRVTDMQFQSTRSRRARLRYPGEPSALTWFQSTRSRRARLIIRRACLQVDRFNPRAREERDTLAMATRTSTTSFNPRAREERDGNSST
ncbi:hypothetical protein CJA_2449 [Cellvibrio japonicus Ueda107]|nr:hypothetical protein CJA_2449 [Cellvibrio japonicus Ueda107]